MAIFEGENMTIYYSGTVYPTYSIDCWCTRWDEGDYDVILETFMTSSGRNALFAHVRPGAYIDLMEGNPLGMHYFRDTTYSKSANTLIIEPMSGYNLSGIRQSRTIAVKSISDTFLTWDKFQIKVEGIRTGKHGL